MDCGIYTLANDKVIDQLIALLNSIEKNSPDYPVCVIPYDQNIDQLKSVIEQRSEQVSLFQEQVAIDRWEDFASKIWQAHPTASAKWEGRGVQGVNRMGMHRRFCAFDGPFDNYVYLDADTLVLDRLDAVFEPLREWDWVVYDFQYKDLTLVFDIGSPRLRTLFTAEQLSNIFCAGMYASRKNIFTSEQLDWLLGQLQTEADVLYINGPDQSIVNYMVLKLGLSVFNLARQLPTKERTGCCVTSSHFEREGDALYDHGNRLTYLHYIGLSSKYFARLCQGENLDFPYRDIFLHYRYLHSPDDRPQFIGKPQSLTGSKTMAGQRIRKLKKLLQAPLKR